VVLWCRGLSMARYLRWQRQFGNVPYTKMYITVNYGNFQQVQNGCTPQFDKHGLYRTDRKCTITYYSASLIEVW